MQLVSICTVLCMLIWIFGATRQYVVQCPGKGFDGQWKIEINKSIIIMFAAVLIIVSTMRYGWIDTYAYKEMYIASRNDLAYVNSAPYGVERGWLYFCYCLNFISSSPKLLLFVSALIIIGGYAVSVWKYSCDPIFSMIIFYCILYMDTNNGLRQMVAASIMIIAFPLLTSKKKSNYIFYALLVWLAMQFHTSASVCLIIAFVVVGKPLNGKVILAAIFGIIFILFPDLMNQYLGEVFSDSKYLNYLDMAHGMSNLRAIATGILPAAITMLYYKIWRRANIEIDYSEGILINTLLINSMFILMGTYMQYWNRMGFYTAFAPVVLLPKLMQNIFVEKQRGAIKLVAIVCYLVFFAYNIYVNIGYGAIEDFYFSWN